MPFRRVLCHSGGCYAILEGVMLFCMFQMKGRRKCDSIKQCSMHHPSVNELTPIEISFPLSLSPCTQCWKDLRSLIQTTSFAATGQSGNTCSQSRRLPLLSWTKSLQRGRQISTSSPLTGRTVGTQCTCSLILTSSLSTGGSISRERRCSEEQPLTC